MQNFTGYNASKPPQTHTIKNLESSNIFKKDRHDRFNILILIKRVKKHAGFTPRMIELLEYYISFTRDIDWTTGQKPIVYQSVYKTALDMGVSERQIQRLEKKLFEVGALCWNDSGNHKRYGVRHKETGRIIYAFGVDLSPLTGLKPKLEKLYIKKQAETAAWMECKRQISFYRRKIRNILDLSDQEQADFERQYKSIAKQIRSHMSLQTLEALLIEHQELYKSIDSEFEKITDPDSKPKKSRGVINTAQKQSNASYKNVKNVAHINIQIHKKFNKLNRTWKNSKNENLKLHNSRKGHVLAIQLASKIIKHGITDCMYTETENKFRSQSDYLDIAFRVAKNLNINEKCWASACNRVGRHKAILAIAITNLVSNKNSSKIRCHSAFFIHVVNEMTSIDFDINKYSRLLTVLR